ncbi:SDR family NAD(P)-dependent oxidoreductase [Actinacidiphila oryziradicis]|uniref:SDR family NAD(P)-dependent oxidoreductase n=1 Tax=Actinacidiphila oryziradicis TaxID=2571141 RepID=UPI003211D06D
MRPRAPAGQRAGGAHGCELRCRPGDRSRPGPAGARVVLAVRDARKGEQAASAVHGHTEVRPLDLSGLESVRRVAQTWSGSLEVLINNAGVMATPLRRTQQGLELQIGTNHLGHFALNNLLLPIRDRVVTISSNAHKAGSIACQWVNPRPNGFSTRVIEQGGGRRRSLAMSDDHSGESQFCTPPGLRQPRLLHRIDAERGVSPLRAGGHL